MRKIPPGETQDVSRSETNLFSYHHAVSSRTLIQCGNIDNAGPHSEAVKYSVLIMKDGYLKFI